MRLNSIVIKLKISSGFEIITAKLFWDMNSYGQFFRASNQGIFEVKEIHPTQIK